MTKFDFFTFVFCPVAGFWMTFQNVQMSRKWFRTTKMTRLEKVAAVLIFALGPLCFFSVPLNRLDFIPLPELMTILILIFGVAVAAIILFAFSFRRWKRDWDENNRMIP